MSQLSQCHFYVPFKNHGRNLRFHQFYSNFTATETQCPGALVFPHPTAPGDSRCVAALHHVCACAAGMELPAVPQGDGRRRRRHPACSRPTWKTNTSRHVEITWRSRGKGLCRAALSESCSLCVHIFVIEKSANIRGFKQIKLAERDHMSIIESSSIIKYQVGKEKLWMCTLELRDWLQGNREYSAIDVKVTGGTSGTSGTVSPDPTELDAGPFELLDPSAIVWNVKGDSNDLVTLVRSLTKTAAVTTDVCRCESLGSLESFGIFFCLMHPAECLVATWGIWLDHDPMQVILGVWIWSKTITLRPFWYHIWGL